MSQPTPQALRAVLNDLHRHLDASEADEPHAVWQMDPATGSKTIVGPFPDRMTAEPAMYQLELRWAEDNEPPMAVFEVIPSYLPDANLLAAISAEIDEGNRP